MKSFFSFAKTHLCAGGRVILQSEVSNTAKYFSSSFQDHRKDVSWYQWAKEGAKYHYNRVLQYAQSKSLSAITNYVVSPFTVEERFLSNLNDIPLKLREKPTISEVHLRTCATEAKLTLETSKDISNETKYVLFNALQALETVDFPNLETKRIWQFFVAYTSERIKKEITKVIICSFAV
jgi:hypothetical protein